ncbi:FMN-dependent 2-nitropropane dioxygenase [Annulohypoxylon maeteangense]|uniref:FMN-dependent 2-nitropropane dioxygenase n=1 Tax=Annulohypoxylon maeteangense TaxID=1927788 RepID=UPI0020077920|nr:FMN-dependent 2-nitropropane dioxygenase [Annulohypoxylon maeteangense]KAI0880769.1 FMN-dependent 2-nitropropane dioxygenase [Annulohypoxylon maeteangense]
MASSRMKSWFPGTEYPLVISAPMEGVTNPRLATEVTKAGGLGFIQGGRDFAPASAQLKRLEDQLTQARSLLTAKSQGEGPNNDDNDPLPIGVGFVTFSATAKQHFAETTIPILKKHKPAAIWLFAPSPDAPDTLPTLIDALKSEAAYSPKIAVQIGSVAAAREAVSHGADIVVAQGTDAGGHQWASGASVVSLVPEVRDMLDTEFPDKGVAVWAAGGIADGRGVAAGLVLGAEGGVLGTRYIVATESDAQDYKREALLGTSDGGSRTVKSQLHDHIQGNKNWPDLYDGRAIITPTYQDHAAGVSLDENTKRFEAAREGGDLSRMVTWSGTGVGLVREELPAAEITRRVREGALKAITGLNASI